MERTDFKLTQDQFILLQHLLPKKYLLIKDTSQSPNLPNINSLQKSSNQISFTSTESPLPDTQPQPPKNYPNQQSSHQSIPPEPKPHQKSPKLRQKSEVQTESQSKRQHPKQQKQFIRQKLKQLLVMLLDAIVTKKSAEIFLQPIDPIKDNIPKYLDIIKNPMDLKTMKTKLNRRYYHTFHDFKKDIDQIVWNCMTFNAGNDYYLKIGTKFEQDCKVIFQKNKEKIQNLSEMLEKFNKLYSKKSKIQESMSSYASTSNKSRIKRTKHQIKPMKTNESENQNEEDELIEKETQQEQTKGSKSKSKVVLQKKNQKVKQSQLSTSRQKIPEIQMKKENKDTTVQHKAEVITKQKEKVNINHQEKIKKLLWRIRVTPKEVKQQFYQSINLKKGQQLDFMSLSEEEFLEIERKFDEFTGKKSEKSKNE